jgi:hypothetical protein
LPKKSAAAAADILFEKGYERACIDDVIARAASAIVHAPRMLALYRVLIAEGRRFPHLAKDFFDQGPSRIADELAKILERQRARGEIRTPDCRLAADQFLGLVRDNHYLAVLLAVTEPPTREEMEARLSALVDLFF